MKRFMLGASVLLMLLVPSLGFSATTVSETTAWFIGTDTLIQSFTASEDATSFSVTVTDISSTSSGFDFESLFVSISTVTEEIRSDKLKGSSNYIKFSFDIDEGVTWYVNIFGVGGGTTGAGLLGILVENTTDPVNSGAVPVPSAFLLLGSGIALLSFKRRSRK